MKPRLVVVNGAPASGKTTLARPLAERLGIPLIEKDLIKDALFEALGTGDSAWSRDLSDASFEVMFALAERSLPMMLDGNFRMDHRERLRNADPRAIEIYCFCSDDELSRRFAERAPTRHPGHLPLTGEELLEGARQGPLELGGPLLRVDTEEPDGPRRAIEWLREQLA